MITLFITLLLIGLGIALVLLLTGAIALSPILIVIFAFLIVDIAVLKAIFGKKKSNGD